MKHTKGPWSSSLFDSTIQKILVKNSEGASIAYCGLPYVFADRKPMVVECVNNALLVAAAPELLEAAEAAQQAIHEHKLLDVKKRFSLCVADAALGKAIKKAKGEG